MINYLPKEPLMFLISFLIFAISITVHEFSHAYSAKLLGDDTAANQGRLTLNPLKHLDPLGTIMILFTSFGWAKPVPVNAMYFKDRKKGMMLSSLAGPLSNLLLALIFAFLYIYLSLKGSYVGYDWMDFLRKLFEEGFRMNILLGIFNMLPVPPLDGSKILSGILPSREYFKLLEYENYITIVFVILMFTGVLGRIILPIIETVQMAIIYVVVPIVKLLV